MTNIENLILRQILPGDNTKKFSLGNEAHTPLKIFLRKRALDFHQTEIAKTYVLVEHSNEPSCVWGYITLMSSEITLNEEQRLQKPFAASKYDGFPAIKIARLAVDKTLQGNGFGKQFLDWCISHVERAIMPHVGCRFLAVDAKSGSVEFYQKSGFVLLDTETNRSNEHPLMFFDLFRTNRLH